MYVAIPATSSKKGEELFNVSIMKQEKAVLAPVAGIVKRVLKTADYKETRKMETVREGELIVELGPVPRICTNEACSRPLPMNDIEFCPYCGETAAAGSDQGTSTRYEERAWEAILMTTKLLPQPKTDKTRFRWKIFSSAWS